MSCPVVERELRTASVAMRMVRVRYVWMRMPPWVVAVLMAMRTGRHGVVHMIMVAIIVAVRVLMVRHFVLVLVAVRLYQVQHHACEH